MKVSVKDAEARLSELVRRAEAGDEIILTSDGGAAVRLVPVRHSQATAARREVLEAVRTSGASRAIKGSTAARSQDFLYGEDGLPQ